MAFYFIYKASKEYKNRGLIPKRLKALGCGRVSRSFWQTEDEKMNDVLKVIRDNQPILLKRTREIRKPKFDDEDNVLDLGSLVVVVYDAEKAERGKTRGMLRRTPCIHLGRSVYAFSQNQSQYDKRGDLIDVGRFYTFLRQLDKDAMIFPRMVIVNANADSIRMILERIRVQTEKEVDEVFMEYKNLLQLATGGEMDKKSLNEEEKKLYRRFVLIKKVANYYEKWLRTDFGRGIMRIYPVTRRLQSISA